MNMSGTTPHGLPFATGTDKVRDGDNAIEALARAVDSYGPIALDLVGTRRDKAAIMVSPGLAATFDANGRYQLNVSATFATVLFATLISGTFPFMCGLTNGAPASLEFFAQFGPGQNVTGSVIVNLFIVGVLK
jgi:hypothetical protein